MCGRPRRYTDSVFRASASEATACGGTERQQLAAGLERAARFYGYEVKWLTPADANAALDLARQSLAARLVK